MFVIRRTTDGLYAYFSAFSGVVWIEEEKDATRFFSRWEAERRVFAGSIEIEIVEASDLVESAQ
jgi:hypothetical protein